MYCRCAMKLNRIFVIWSFTEEIVGWNGQRWGASSPPEFHGVFPALQRHQRITFAIRIRSIAARWKSRVTLTGACGHQRQPRVTAEISHNTSTFVLSSRRDSWRLLWPSKLDVPDAISAIVVGFPTGKFSGDCRRTFSCYLLCLLCVPHSDETVGIACNNNNNIKSSVIIIMYK